MDRRKARYKRMESMITIALCLDALIFIAYMIFAGMGMLALKVVATILCILISGVVLYYLYITRELLRRRSMWMTLAAVCIILCLVVSLVLNFPAPRFTITTV